MSERGLRFTGIILAVTGFALWAYGFVYSSFWYANVDASILKPAREWVSEIIDRPIPPCVIEEIVGLAVAVTGILLQVISYYGKKS